MISWQHRLIKLGIFRFNLAIGVMLTLYAANAAPKHDLYVKKLQLMSSSPTNHFNYSLLPRFTSLTPYQSLSLYQYQLMSHAQFIAKVKSPSDDLQLTFNRYQAIYFCKKHRWEFCERWGSLTVTRIA
ncbi:hypothetical protein [Shewanella psychrotolerans]|uniref:hypothetical protein n=1 Tax=Shewanella psychrotolerans TaxID=2864206 RepID=UPI001C656013|nr:hypothetical protein [Shewanella psychrotolerans]QYJ99772.1 hypothetical protein K0I62_09830 [Shewanella psychrotolerans]